MIECFSKAYTKQTFTNSQKNTFSKTAVFNQNPMEIPSGPVRKQMFLNQTPMKIASEPIRKQKFFNQNPMEIPSEPIRRERICQNFFKALREGPDF